ncbi:MAG: cyclic nucleotide-binding domain-containing protein [Spirochaetaceae bacterium]|jgi:CRP-like cAMP-binding protein|nr:cyclic nucleotide-binding domain-containing protein [Spirochaetaceae bacterium]
MSEKLELTFVNFSKNSYITMEGRQNADRFFIIHQGKVRLSKEVEVVTEEGRDILGPGDFFAVISTMSSHSHIETAQAVTDVTLISVKKEQYGQLIQNNTPVAMKIIMQFSKRMRYLDEALTRLTLKNTVENDIAHLFDVGTYYNKQGQFDQAYYAYHQYIKYCPEGKNVNQAREQMMKIAPYTKNTELVHESDEFNREYPKNSMFFSEGEPGDELYIIQKGSVKITKIVDSNEVLLAVLKTGDIFGEMALLESKPRSASAIAFEDSTVLAVNRTNFVRMVGTQPQIIARLTILLSERLWFIYKQLANTQIVHPLGRMYDALLIQLEKNRVPLSLNESYVFDFGPLELFNMVGLSRTDGMPVFMKMTETGKIQVVQDKIMVMHVLEIPRQTDFFKKRNLSKTSVLGKA